ncbi:RHS repeat-associated core domain-containing protein [Clostridium sp. KNHs214]|uniref:RHS repeat-associated core domain-containing protein n=1 Tax=Clostridium sp. KNHs214 TaxID=1540257 RepID=UPI0009DCF52F|nr:RHS repeat-associated core domain-containing protein [Clostridium sp. KNHs214]
MIKSVSPKGSEFKYKYDSKHNLLNATSGENVVYSFEYDSSGNAKKAKIGSNTLFMQSKAEYTSDGNYLKSMTDSSGNTVQYNYDTKKGTLKSATDAKGNSISYEYDNLDRLVKTKGKANSSTEAVNSYSYSNDKLKNIGHNDFNYSFDYDAFGRNSKVNISNGNGTKNLIENIYEQVTGMLKTSKYGNGHVINYKYDNSDRVSEISYSGGSTSQGSFSYEYDASGNLANHYDKVNNVNYRYIYDAADRLVKIKDSKGDTLKYGYDEDNNVSSINEKINNNSYVTKYEYDNDNKLSKVHYNTKGQSSEKTETFPLNNSLKSLSGIEPYSQNTIFEKDETTGRNVLGAYEGSKNLIPNSSFEDGTKSWRISDWNRFSGNCRIVDDGVKGSKCIESYDTKGSSGTSNTNSVAYQEITFPSPLSTAKEYTLSAYAKRIGASQPKLSVECTDSSGKQLYYIVDTKEIPERQWKRISHTFTLPAKTKMCRVIIRTGVKNTDVVRFDGVQFEEKGFVTPYTSSSSNATKILYNLNVNKNAGTMGTWFKTRQTGTVRHIISNEGKNSEILNTYIDKNNKLNIAIKKGDGSFTNLVTSKETIDKDKWYFTAITWQFKENKLTVKFYLNDKLVGQGITESFKDFSKGSTALGSSIKGTEQLNGNLEQFTYSSQTLSEEQISNLYKNTLTSNSTLSLNYDSLGRMISKKLSTGLKDYITKYEFEAGKEANTATSIVKSIDNGGEKICYTYDKNGNIETIVQNKGTEKEKTIKYHYDGLNQITREDNGILGKTITYSYDRGGNLTSKKEYKYTTAESLGNCTKAYNYNYGDSIWKDKLTNFDGKEITYDNIGNPLTYNGYTFTWERGRMLSSIKGNGKDIKFKYNDQGIRTEKTVNGVTTKYHLVGGSVTYEDNGKDKIHYTYDSSGKLISMNLNGAEYYYVRNAQGDIIGLINAQGEKVVSYTYDSWGKLISIEGSLKDTVGEKNPYRYRGYRYDSETGLYYLQNRYYNPEWARFINADEIIGETGELLGHNLFAYSKNNCANMSDYSGFRPVYTLGEETEAMRAASYAVMNRTRANRTNVVSRTRRSSNTAKSSFNYAKSTLKSMASGAADYVSGKVAVNAIRGRLVWKPHSTLAMGRYVSNLGRGAKFAKKSLGIAGTIGFCTWDVHQSLRSGEKVGALIDVLSAAAGVAAGVVISGVVAAAVSVGAPALLVGAVGFGVNVLIGVKMDKYVTRKKDEYYGR